MDMPKFFKDMLQDEAKEYAVKITYVGGRVAMCDRGDGSLLTFADKDKAELYAANCRKCGLKAKAVEIKEI